MNAAPTSRPADAASAPSAGPSPGTEAPAAPVRPPNPLVDGPILPRLIRLAVPNLLAMFMSSMVTLTETSYIGALGTTALAGMALAFPMVMLQGMLSAGAMGGGMSSAVSRALGAGDVARANALAAHATVIGAVIGLFFMVVFLAFGRPIYRLLGGEGEALAQALAFSNVVFVAVVSIWLNNTFGAILRGTGNMRAPSIIQIVLGFLQLGIGGAFGLGWGPFPRLGMPGVALGTALANVIGMCIFLYYLRSGRMKVRLSLFGTQYRREMFWDILKVGGFSLLGPSQSMATILTLTALMSRQGTEVLAGYGIGIRMEFLLIPITFAFGVAAVPMVGMAIGAGQVERARKVAWTAALVTAAIIGVMGLTVAFTAENIARFFSQEPAVLAAAKSFFVWAGPCYAMFGIAHCLYFASQGSGRMLGPILAGTARLSTVVIGGVVLLSMQAPTWMYFALLSAAMIVYGSAAALAMRLSSWAPRGALSR